MKLVSLMVFIHLMSCTTLTAKTVIHAGQLIDTEHGRLLKQQTIFVENGKVVQLLDGYAPSSKTDTIVDLKAYTVMPGLMDMHTHISLEYGPHAQVERFTLNEADRAIKGLKNAEKTVLAGFTTIRDLGDSYNETIAIRKAINSGLYPGPTIYTASKSIATTGGHADPTNGTSWRNMLDVGPLGGVINGPAEAYQAVRHRYKVGADLIKITATGGVLSVAKSGQNPQFTNTELEAIVAAAKDYGFTVAVHAHGKEGMKRAILAGVDSIEHGTFMDKEIFRLMKKHKVYYVPTIMAGNWVAEKAKIDGFFPELLRSKAANIGPKLMDTFKRAYQSGVAIAFGTDSGVSSHGDNWQEFTLMVRGGMPPMEAIQAATVEAAKLLKIQKSVGIIKSGMVADIIAVNGNPLNDIRAMKNVTFVMSRGQIVRRP